MKKGKNSGSGEGPGEGRGGKPVSPGSSGKLLDAFVFGQISFYCEIRNHLAGRGLWHELMIHPAAIYASGGLRSYLSGKLSAKDFCRAMRDYIWNLIPMYGEAPIDICPENPEPPAWWRCTGGEGGPGAVDRAVSKLAIRGREGEVRERLEETLRRHPGIERLSELICRSMVLALPGVSPLLPDAVSPDGEPSFALLLCRFLDEDDFWPKPGASEGEGYGPPPAWAVSGRFGTA